MRYVLESEKYPGNYLVFKHKNEKFLKNLITTSPYVHPIIRMQVLFHSIHTYLVYCWVKEYKNELSVTKNK